MRLVFMGTPDYAVPVLEALNGAPGLQTVGVYTPPDRPRGRGRGVEATPVKLASLKLGLPVYQPASFRPSVAQEQLAALEPDVIVVAAYGKLLPPEVLETAPHGCLNIHPSLLPRYRGPSPVVTAILDGAQETGVTLMLLDEGMDTGPIVAQRQRPLDGTETAGQLTGELFRLGAELLLQNLTAWTSNGLKAIPQDNSRATVTRKLERSDGVADWSLSASELAMRQRAFTPWPGFFTQWQGKKLRLVEVCAGENLADKEGRKNPPPGEVVTLPLADVPVGIGTARGILGLKIVQLEGRRATSAAQFLRGYSHFPGSSL